MSEDVNIEAPEVPEIELPAQDPASQEPGSDPSPDPTQSQTIPYPRFQEVVHERNALRAELEAAKAATPPAQQSAASPQPQQPQFYSWATLRAAADQGTITEEQAQTQWATQNQQLATHAAERAARDVMREQTVQSGFDQYKQAIPDLMTPGSANSQKFQTELNHFMTNLGAPDNAYTRIAAARSAFGSPESIRQIRQGTVPLQASPEIGGGRPAATPTSNDKRDTLKSLPQDEVAVYADLIKKGVYRDWKEVRTEIEFSKQQTVNPRLRG